MRELTGHVRNLYLIAAVGDGHGIVDASAEDLARIEAQSAEFGGPDRLARMLDLLGELGAEMRWSSDPRLSLEVALTRMARPVGEMTLEALAERVEALEAGTSARVVQTFSGAPVVAQVREARSRERGAEADRYAPPPRATKEHEAAADVAAGRSAEAQPLESVASAATMTGAELDTAAAKRAWPAVVAEIRRVKATRAEMYGRVEVDVDADRHTLVLEFPADQEFAMQMAEEPDMRELAAARSGRRDGIRTSGEVPDRQRPSGARSSGRSAGCLRVFDGGAAVA